MILFFGTVFLHINGTQRDKIKLQCDDWFESIKRLALVSVVKKYFCVHILKFYMFWVSDWTGGISSVGRAHDCRAGGRGFDSRDWTITQGLKITEKRRSSLCTSSGWTFAWFGWPRKMAVPSPVGDVKIVPTISNFVVNTFALKWSCTPSGPVRPRLIQHELLVGLEFDKYCNLWLWLVRYLIQCDQG